MDETLFNMLVLSSWCKLWYILINNRASEGSTSRTCDLGLIVQEQNNCNINTISNYRNYK